MPLFSCEKNMVLTLMILIMMSSSSDKRETAVFGGGCFWCTEAVFQQVKGVEQVVPGYSGGALANPTYKEVTSGETGHAEVVKIIFNPTIVSYEQLLEIFFEIHDPTTLNRQGADVGTQYRSVIYYTNSTQKETASMMIGRLSNTTFRSQRIVTEVDQLNEFYKAEEYHQNYYQNNKTQPYCQFVVRPKMEKFNFRFENLRK